MGDDTSALAWELLAKLTYITGRIYAPSAETAHDLLVAWLSESDGNRGTAEEWLTATGGSAPVSPSEEFRLRAPIEEALGVRRHGGGGRVGLLGSYWPRSFKFGRRRGR